MGLPRHTHGIAKGHAVLHHGAVVLFAGVVAHWIMAEGLGSPKTLDIQVANVHKTLLSVGKLARAGNSVMFSEVFGNYIMSADNQK